MVTFKQAYDDVYGVLVSKAEVSPIVMALNGKEIEVEGYFIPLTGKIGQSHFMLSALPQNICFFCGGAGPETVMEVEAQEGVKYQDDAIYLKGILRTNADDINRLMYKLENAVVIDAPSQ